jgi:iron-sulfur cluster repair protein YtfE (RIC family)
MPNVIELLNQDHRKVERLFAQFEATQDADVAHQICDELTVHAAVEEEIVYPVLERIDAPLEHEAEQEHAEAKELIARIQGMTAGDPDLVATVTKLKAGIEHHVAEEEGEAWPKMRSGAGTRLDDLGDAVEQRKAELTGRATPGAPTEVRGTATTTEFASMTKDELYKLARERDIDGRSKMKKDELIRALSRS